MCDNNRDEFDMTEVMEKEIKDMLKEDTQLILEGVIDGDRQLVVRNKMVWDNIINDGSDSEINAISPYRRTFIHSKAFQVGMRRIRSIDLQQAIYYSYRYDYDDNIPFWYSPKLDRVDIENTIKKIMLPVINYTPFDPVRFMMSPIPPYDSSLYYSLSYLTNSLHLHGVMLHHQRTPNAFQRALMGFSYYDPTDYSVMLHRRQNSLYTDYLSSGHTLTLHGRSLGKTDSIHSTFTDLVSLVRRQRVDHKFYQSKQKHFGRRSL